MNKILVGIIAAAIIGGMAFMQPTEAQADDCGPYVSDYVCHPKPAYILWWEDCPQCGINWENYFDDWEHEDPRWNEYLAINNVAIYDVNQKIDVLSDKLDTLSNDVNSLSDNVQNTSSGDDVIIIIIVIVCLLVISIGLQIASLARKR